MSLLGCALLTAADHGHPRGDLDQAVQALQRSVDLTPAGHVDLAARQSNLASALMDRFERAGNTEDIRAAAALQQAALESMEPGDARRGQVLNNLGNAHLALYRHTWQEEDLTAAAGVLPLLIQTFGEGNANFAVARSNAGLIANELAARSGDDDMLELAITLHAAAVRATPPRHPLAAGRRASLALSLMQRYERHNDEADLQAALELGEQALAAEPGAPHERAIFLSSQGTAYHEAFLRTGRIRDLEQAARLQLAALDIIPRHSPFAAAMLNNAAIALNDRYERLGDPDDLQAALRAAHASLEASPSTVSTDRASRLNNLALTLHRLFEQTGDADALTGARKAANEALQLADQLHSSALKATTFGTLVDVLSTASRDLDDPSARTELRQLWQETDVAALESKPASAPLWLLRRALQGNQGESAADRRRLLLEAAEAGLERRPAVTLSAARQLATDALIEHVAGRERPGDVTQASDLAARALTRLRAGQDSLRHALSWQRQAAGMAAVLAQGRALIGDVEGAAEAFEAGHAVLIGARAQPTEPSGPRQTTVTVWATLAGGAAIVRRPDGDPQLILLPLLTSERVEGWTRLLQKAARLSSQVLDRVLARVAVEMTPAVTAPVTAALRPGEPLCWVGGGLVALLPLTAAGTADGSLLGEQHVVRTAPTAGLGASTERVAAERGFAGEWWSIGSPAPSTYPPLPGAAREMAAFAAPEHRRMGSDATPMTAAEALARASVAHFATHGRTSAADPLMNHLLFAEDGPLFADDIAGLTTPARLVVLSACDTAAPGAAHADESLGLAGAFLAAGVPGVIASLWSVGDEGTSRYMTRVAHLLHDGHQPAEALHRAAVAARQDHASAGDWAAFSVLGS